MSKLISGLSVFSCHFVIFSISLASEPPVRLELTETNELTYGSLLTYGLRMQFQEALLTVPRFTKLLNSLFTEAVYLLDIFRLLKISQKVLRSN